MVECLREQDKHGVETTTSQRTKKIVDIFHEIDEQSTRGLLSL